MESVEADCEVAERGHDLCAVAGSDLGVVLGEGHVADPVWPVFYGPVPADRVGELGGGGVVVGKVGNCVHGLPADLGAGKRPAGAGDLDRQRGVGEDVPGRDGSKLDGPGLDSAVALVGGGVSGGDLPPGDGP